MMKHSMTGIIAAAMLMGSAAVMVATICADIASYYLGRKAASDSRVPCVSFSWLLPLATAHQINSQSMGRQWSNNGQKKRSFNTL